MKKLIFIRHGRAEEQIQDISDFERSLTTKGKIISGIMAGKLKEKENPTFLIISSPAFRALETAIIFAREFGIDSEKIVLNSKIYFKMNMHFLQDIISDLDEDIDAIALFGHNPSFTELADRLTHDGCEFLPKSGVVGIYFNVKTWPEVISGTGKVEYFLKPGKEQ
jgi:phosphohistidine phosphatase